MVATVVGEINIANVCRKMGRLLENSLEFCKEPPFFFGYGLRLELDSRKELPLAKWC
jgi:hypothetical protein